MLSSLLIIPLVFWAAAEGTDLSAKKSESSHSDEAATTLQTETPIHLIAKIRTKRIGEPWATSTPSPIDEEATTEMPMSPTHDMAYNPDYPLKTSPRCLSWQAVRDDGGTPYCPASASYDSKLDCCSVSYESKLPVPTTWELSLRRNPHRYVPSVRCVWWRAPRNVFGDPECPDNMPYEREYDCCAVPTLQKALSMPTCISGRALRNRYGVPKCPEFAPYDVEFDCCAIERKFNTEKHQQPALPSVRCLSLPAPRNDSVPLCPDYAPYERISECCAIPLSRWQPPLPQPDTGIPVLAPCVQELSNLESVVRTIAPICIDWLVLADAPNHNCPDYAKFEVEKGCCAIPLGSVMPHHLLKVPMIPLVYCVSHADPGKLPVCPDYAPFNPANRCCAILSDSPTNSNETLRSSRCIDQEPKKPIVPPFGPFDCPQYTIYEQKFDCCAYPKMLNAIELVPFPKSEEPEYGELNKNRCILWPRNADLPVKHDCPPNSRYLWRLKCCAIAVGSAADNSAEDSAKTTKAF